MQAPAVIGFLSFRSVKAHAAACTPAGEPHEPAPLLRSRPLAGGSIGVGGCRTNKLVGSPFFVKKNKNAVPQDHALGVKYKYEQK